MAVGGCVVRFQANLELDGGDREQDDVKLDDHRVGGAGSAALLRIRRDRTRNGEREQAPKHLPAMRMLPSRRAASGMFGELKRPGQGLRQQPSVARRASGIGAGRASADCCAISCLLRAAIALGRGRSRVVVIGVPHSPLSYNPGGSVAAGESYAGSKCVVMSCKDPNSIIGRDNFKYLRRNPEL